MALEAVLDILINVGICQICEQLHQMPPVREEAPAHFGNHELTIPKEISTVKTFNLV